MEMEGSKKLIFFLPTSMIKLKPRKLRVYKMEESHEFGIKPICTEFELSSDLVQAMRLGRYGLNSHLEERKS